MCMFLNVEPDSNTIIVYALKRMDQKVHRYMSNGTSCHLHEKYISIIKANLFSGRRKCTGSSKV